MPDQANTSPQAFSQEAKVAWEVRGRGKRVTNQMEWCSKTPFLSVCYISCRHICKSHNTHRETYCSLMPSFCNVDSTITIRGERMNKSVFQMFTVKENACGNDQTFDPNLYYMWQSTKTFMLSYYLFPGTGLLHDVMMEIRSFIVLGFV